MPAGRIFGYTRMWLNWTKYFGPISGNDRRHVPGDFFVCQAPHALIIQVIYIGTNRHISLVLAFAQFQQLEILAFAPN
jgi:hypothetical protein